jgi:hypothetical protein
MPEGDMILEDVYRSRANISATVFGAALIIGLTRLSSLLPSNYYFTYEGFILNPDPEVHWISIVAKLFIPSFVGVLLGYIWRDESKTASGVAGFVGPFLMLWPFLTQWNAIAPHSISAQFNTFVFLYCIYILASTYLTKAGALAGEYLGSILKVSFVAGEPIVISFSEIMKTATKGVIAFVTEQVLHKFLAH